MGFWSDLLGVLGNTFRIGRRATFDASGLSAARTFTLPDATGTLVVGAGLPAGGTTGQVLTKTSGTDFAVAWDDPTGGGGADADPFTFTQNFNATPGAGEFAISFTPESFLIHKEDSASNQWGLFLDEVRAGWLIEIYDPADQDDNFLILKVASVSLDGDVYTFTGTFVKGEGDVTLGGLKSLSFEAGFASAPSGPRQYYGTDGDAILGFHALSLSALGNPTSNTTFDFGSTVHTWNWSSLSNNTAIDFQISSQSVFYLEDSGGEKRFRIGNAAKLIVNGNVDFSGMSIELRFGDSGSTLAFFGGTPAARQAFIASPSGGATVDDEARAAIDAIRDLLMAYNLKASS